MIKVSIISPVYNVEKYLPRFLKSIENQELKEYELILVDDGSVDNSFEICTAAAKKDSRIKVVHQKNQGSGAARNTGLNIAKGKYVYFCDPDDYIEEDLLYKNYLMAEKNKSNVIIFGYYIEDLNKNVLQEIVPNKENYESSLSVKKIFPYFFEKPLIYYVWNKLYLRKAIDGLRFDTARTGQDFRFNLKFFENVSRVCCNDGVFYHYLSDRPGSAQNAINLDKKIKKMYDLIEENKIIYSLIFNKWEEKSNSLYIDLMNNRNLDVIRQCLNTSSFLNINERKKFLNSIFSDAQTNHFIDTYKFKTFKEKYILFLIKHRNSNFVLLFDKKLRRRHI